MANVFDKDHQAFFKLLDKHQVEYLLIGGVAVNLYGYARGTGDVDILIGSSAANKQKLISAIEAFGYDTQAYQTMALDAVTMFSLGDRNRPGHIELTNRIDGITFEEAYTRAQAKEVEGVPVKVIHYKDLIVNKIMSGRPRDLDDVENLKKIEKAKKQQ